MFWGFKQECKDFDRRKRFFHKLPEAYDNLEFESILSPRNNRHGFLLANLIGAILNYQKDSNVHP